MNTESMPNDDGVGLLRDADTGETVGESRGHSNFQESWSQFRDVPELISYSGWQMDDVEHAAGEGVPGYRLVHKMIRTIPYPAAEITLGKDIKLRIRNAVVTTSTPTFLGALPWRREGEYLIPEWGNIGKKSEETLSYAPSPSTELNISNELRTFPSSNHVEILCRLPPSQGTNFQEQLAAGRSMVATVTTALDLLFGPRLLGPILAEEVGAVFDDWHWNRRLDGRSVGMEGQARLEHYPGDDLIAKVRPVLERLGSDSMEHQQRCRIASQWYWRAEREPDRVVQYISYWLILEALELEENISNVNLVKDAVASLLGVDRSAVSDRIGRLYNVRNKLLHGKQQDVNDENLSLVITIANALLEEHLIGKVSEDRLEELKSTLA